MKMFKKLAGIVSLILIISLTVNACSTTPLCITSSTSPVNKHMEIKKLGKTSGTDSAWSVLGLWMVGRPDIDLALKEALKKKGGDVLINVRCYEDYKWYLFFSISRVVVEGEAVKFIRKPKSK